MEDKTSMLLDELAMLRNTTIYVKYDITGDMFNKSIHDEGIAREQEISNCLRSRAAEAQGLRGL